MKTISKRNDVWQEITLSDEELEDLIAGIPKTRRGQRRNLSAYEDAPFNDEDEEEDEEYYD
jgi:hypothetical protein